MKEMTLLIGHGSRDSDGNREFTEFAQFIRKELPQREIVTCFLELATPDIPSGIHECVKQGATRILVLPLILLAAMHVKYEIPEFLAAAREQYPDVEIIYGKNVGLHKQIIDLLEDRFNEVVESFENQSLKDTAIVVMGRGSSDADANGDLYKISRLLFERKQPRTIEVCFSGITTPLLPEGIERTVHHGAKRIIVVPYFLFTGVLIKRMKGILNDLKTQYPGVELHMAHYFGMHSDLIAVVVDRIREMDVVS